MSALGVPAVASVSASVLDFLLLEATREYLDKGEAGHRALDRIGYTVGSQLAERYTKDRPRFGDATEVILCVCKEFWPAVFGKRIDSLKTNNKGVFVLTDVQLKWIGNVRAVGHSNADGENKKKQVSADVARIPSGMLSGFLNTCGFAAEVTADTSNAPQCMFTIRL